MAGYMDGTKYVEEGDGQGEAVAVLSGTDIPGPHEPCAGRINNAPQIVKKLQP